MEREKLGRKEWDQVLREKISEFQNFAAREEITVRNLHEGIVSYSDIVIWTAEGFPEGEQAREDVAELVYKVRSLPHNIEAAERAARRLRMHTVGAPENASPFLRGLTGERTERAKVFYSAMTVLSKRRLPQNK